ARLEAKGSTVYLEQDSPGRNGFELPPELTQGRRLVFPGWGDKAKKSDPGAVAVVRADGPLAGPVRGATSGSEPVLGAPRRRAAGADGLWRRAARGAHGSAGAAGDAGDLRDAPQWRRVQQHVPARGVRKRSPRRGEPVSGSERAACVRGCVQRRAG